jgi:hypothetical protein
VKGCFELSVKAKVLSPPTILLHIHLHSIAHIAHFQAAENLLFEYYHNSPGLLVIDLPFNIPDNCALENWMDEATETVSGLSGYKHLITSVTTHSDPTTGDLWLGSNANGKPCAAAPSNVSIGLSFHADIDHGLNSGLITFLVPSSSYFVDLCYTYWHVGWL